jgi:hypothetical protein
MNDGFGIKLMCVMIVARFVHEPHYIEPQIRALAWRGFENYKVLQQPHSWPGRTLADPRRLVPRRRPVTPHRNLRINRGPLFCDDLALWLSMIAAAGLA